MTKDELASRLRKGEKLQDIIPLVSGQECEMYKAVFFTKGDEILYIPDIELNGIPTASDLSGNEDEIRTVVENCYTGDDFINMCNGNIKLAKELFDYCDWQHPSSAMDEITSDDSGWIVELSTLPVGDDLFLVTESEAGEPYTIKCKYVQDLLDDWNGECEYCPSNDARVFFACWNGTPFNPFDYKDFGTFMENVIIPKFSR